MSTIEDEEMIPTTLLLDINTVRSIRSNQQEPAMSDKSTANIGNEPQVPGPIPFPLLLRKTSTAVRYTIVTTGTPPHCKT